MHSASVKEAFVMVCDHLRLNLFDQVICNTCKDKNRSSRKPDIFNSGHSSNQCRNQNDRREEKSINPVHTACCTCYEIRCRTTGTNAGNKSAIFLEIVGNLDRIKLNH